MTIPDDEATMQIEFERGKLYQEVWTVPVSTLAKRYGLSDNGLRRVCAALAIPLPARGYWAKVAAGHKIEVPPLLPAVGRTHFVSRPAVVERIVVAPLRDDPVLMAALTFEAVPENFIEVTGELIQPHPIVRETAKKVRDEIDGIERDRAEQMRPKKPRLHSAPKLRSLHKGPSWFMYRLRHVLELGGDILPMKVSIDTAERALRIWDALIEAFGVRQLKVMLTPRGLLVTDGVDGVAIRMAERVEGKGERRTATGVLRISFGPESRDRVIDEPGRPLENQLNYLLCCLHRRLASVRRTKLADSLRREIELAAEAERERIEAVAVESARLLAVELQRQEVIKAEERAREAQLVAESSAWQQAETIRAYVAHLTSTFDSGVASAAPELRQWVAWATGVADRMDPTTRRRTASES